MKTIIGTVKELKGDYFAQDSAGNIIKLQVGDKITNDMLVYGAENNAKNAEIKIAMMNMGDVFSLSGMQKQAFDPSLTDIDTIDDAISPKSLNKALLTEAYDENIYSDEETSVDKEDDTFNDETEAGEERVVGQSTDDVFLARDGDSVDIVSTLRNARFSLGNLASGENEIFSSQLESLSTTGVSTPPSATPDYLLAQFTDNFVSGVTYTTSSGLSGLTGDSGVAGEFKYKDGDTITFTVGDVVVAEFSADVIQGDILFIQDIAGEALSESNAMYVENMAIFLQALDADLQDTTPDDGVLQTNALVNNAQSYSTNITITEEIREAFTGYIDPTTGKALNIAESGKQMISDALAHVNIEFTRDTERDEENFENVFETVAMEHVADTIQELAGERAPESAQEREADIIEVPGSVIKYNYLTDVTGNATISFSTDDLLVGAVGQQVITENLLVKNVVLGAGYESIGTLVNDGNGQYHIELNDDVTPYDLEGLTIDYRVEDWTVYRDVTSTTLDTYKSHLSATVENVPEDAQYNQFTLNSSLVFSEDQSLTIKFSPETSGIDFAEYSDDFTVPLEYSNDGGVTWKSMEVVGNYMRDDYDKPLPIFGFELEAGSESVEIRVPIFDDPYEESDIEVIDMLIEGENFYAENLQPGIIDNDPIVEVDFAIVSEDDGEAVITISLVDANKNPITSGENITVTYQTADLSAKAGEDYTPITGTITIPAGQNSVTVAVPIIDDTIIEETEFLSLELTSVSSNAVLGDPEASIRIYDNDVIKVTGETNEEGERVVFKVDVSDYVPSNAILKLHPTNSGATATQDLDYDSTTLRAYYVDASGEHTLVTDANSGFSLPEGVSEFFVSYESIDDTLLENPESVKMQVSASFEDGSGESVQKIGLGTATIVEKTPSISVSAASAQEGEYEVFTVSLSNQSTQNVSFDLTTATGTASATDYAAASMQVSTDGGTTWTDATSATIAAGETSVLVRVPTVEDTIDESDETFTLTATVTSGDTTNASSTGVATITDDDMSPISITIPAQNSTDAQGVILDVSSSFYDTDALTYSAIGLPTGLTIDSTTGVISGTIDNSASQGGVNGTYTVTVIATDGVNPATSQSFAWSVTNPAPTALDDGVIEITEDTATVITVLNNDSDPDGDTLSVISVTQPSNGVVSLVNGIITYTPSANYNGADSFTYTISDGEGGVDTATVTLNVTPVIDTFTDADELVSCNEDATLNGNVLENLVDTNGLSLNVVSFSVGSQVGTLGEALTIANVGSIEINSDGSYTFIPLANYNGSVPVINYTVSNGESTDDSSLSITVVPQNDAPTLLGATARVSEEGLTQGLQDDEGANIGDDTTNATVTTGTLSFADIDGDSLTAAIAAPTETFTSGGETIVWSGSGTATLTGSVNGNTVITVEITDQQTGTYKVNLLAPIDHPVNSVEDTLTLGFDVTVSDGVDTSNATLNVVVEDDMAFAGDIVKSVEIPQQNTNLLFMIDTSGSMGWDAQTGSSYITTVERMELLLTSMREVIESYAQMGSVRIQITTFNSGDSTHQDHWFTVSEALAFIGDGTAGSRDSSLNPSGGTNYDEALAEAQTAYAIDGKLEASAGAEIANVAYFLSDGQPQTAGGIESSYGITGTEITAWTNFLVANDISSYAVGFGSGLDSSDQAYLDPIAYDGLNETERDGVIVADSSTLADTLLSTVQPPLVGNVLGELGLDGFGADGGYFETIVIDGVTYTYDIVNNQITNSLNADIISGAILTLTTSNQGGLELNFDTGVYEYQPDGTLAQGESRVEFIEFTAVDGDGDTSTGTATLNISRAAKEIPVLSADIATVDESAMSTGSDSTNIVTPAISNVATGNIFANDTIPSGTSLSAITIDGAISSVDAGGVITVTTQEGNTLVVDKSTGDYTYTLINALEHYEKTEIANSAINDSDTFSTIYGGNSVTREYDYGIGHAGHTVTVQMNIDVYNYRWEEGSDEVTVTLNGQNSVSQTLSDDGTILLNVVLDEFGKFVLDIDNNANNSNESLTINNFSVVGNDNIIIIGAPLDTLVDSFTYSVTDRDGDVYSSTLDVTINDDVPSVNDEAAVSVSLVEAPVTNILLTLDVSGSMSTTVGGVSRLDIAKAALIDTIQAYENQGAANVNLTLFASSAVNVSNGWMSSTAAINYISGLYLDSNDNIRYDNGDGNLTNDTIVGIDGQMTNYEDAVAVTASNYNLSLPDADKYVAYLISDGAPTRENIEGSDVSGNVGQDSESGWIDTPYLNSWNSFINSNNIALEVIGIGTNLDETYLDMLQVIDGKTSTIVADETKLSEVMLSSVQSVQGSLYGNDSSAGILFGADGGNILEITYEGTTYSYDEANPVQSIVLSQGEMELDFETGNFTYTPTTTTSSDIVEDFIVSVTDSDGDTTLDKPLQLTISTDGAYAYDGSAIDGEGGYDTVTFSADTINFDNINNIVNVEALDLTVGDKTVSISLDDVLNITDANEHKLTIEGDSGDTLNVDTSGWTQDSVVDNGETTTYEYSKGSDSISLTVDDQIDTTGM